MEALVFHKPKDVRVDNVEDPRIQDPRDAIIRVTLTAICGSDLHLYNGLILQPRPMTLGHEFMGIVEDVGSEVTNLKKGDRVVVPFPIACGRCWFGTHALPLQWQNPHPARSRPRCSRPANRRRGPLGPTAPLRGLRGLATWGPMAGGSEVPIVPCPPEVMDVYGWV